MAGDRKRLRCDEYHVAWICPVADLELLPARLMLDEEHHTPQYDTHFDENTYVFGSINGHAVVIATCPRGQTGNVNASRLTAPMFKTFTNIRMVLLVGIGGGIPRPTISENPTENIHLGDVVVGYTSDSRPACIYHERGRSKVNGEFEILGGVQDPDWRLTNALDKLASDHDVDMTSFDDHLKRLQNHRKGNIFAQPSHEYDKLFKAAYCHIGDYYSRCAHCDRSELVHRPQRNKDPYHTFVFHFGRIATGNAVIQDSERRDWIGSQCDGALCVEMEAAGVNVNKPCLVIRGISDYADSHKSDVWRNYAAGKAAAFARELLYKVPSGTSKKKGKEDENENKETHEAPWLVPLPRPPSYVGREIQLARLDAHISSKDSRRLAICGLGGCGKTALALEVAYRVRETQPTRSVFWVPAVSQASFEQAFREIGEQLRIPKITDSKSNTKQLVKKKLSDESSGPWLMIVDNADDSDILHSSLGETSDTNRLMDYLPYSREGSIIFTTRTSHVAVDLAEHNVIELGKLDETEAKQLLRTRLFPKNQHQVDDNKAAAEFLSMLGFFALAIVQAVAFINKNHSSLSKYTQLFKASEQEASRLLSKEFTDQGRYKETKNPVATTWFISFEQIRKHDKLAAEYLSFMACTSNTDIPASMLPVSDSEIDQTDALGILKAYGFITQRQHRGEEQHGQEVQDTQAEAFDIHPLVHLAIRTWLKDHYEWHFWVEKTVKRMQELVPFGDIQTRKVWTPCLPHARQVCDLSKLNHPESWADLIDRIARCHDALGQYRVAEQDFRQLLAYEKSALGEKHPDTLMSLVLIGSTLHRQGNYREAEQMYRETLVVREEILGQEDPQTLASMAGLALAIERQGRYIEAEEIYRKTLVLYTKVCGKEHPDTLTSMNNLAGALSYQEKYQEAEEMHRKTLELSEKVLGKEHPDTLTSMNNLATTLSNQEKYQEAEEMHRKTLELRDKVLGIEHEGTLFSVWGVGYVLCGQDRYEEALFFYERAYKGFERILGPDHQHTQKCGRDYAIAQKEAGVGSSNSDDEPVSDEPYDDLGNNYDSEEPETKAFTAYRAPVQEEVWDEEQPVNEKIPASEQIGKGSERIPHLDQAETPIYVKDDAPVQQKDAAKQGANKIPPLPKRKPSLLKGHPLRSLGSSSHSNT